MHNRYAFVGGNLGGWQIVSMSARRGPELAPVAKLDFVRAPEVIEPGDSGWVLHGLVSNVRYAQRSELDALRARQEPLGRPFATRAALIPIKKSNAWWELAQDERRAIFEETSHHTAIGMDYLPAVARQLFHCRDIAQPFDLLTWFEYSADEAGRFEELVARLRETAEWGYVEREVDIRLERR